MTTHDIEVDACNWVDNFGGSSLKLADVALLSYRKGATIINEMQPYTAEDMQSFWIWANANGYYYAELSEIWMNDDIDDFNNYTLEEVIKLWEESKNG